VTVVFQRNLNSKKENTELRNHRLLFPAVQENSFSCYITYIKSQLDGVSEVLWRKEPAEYAKFEQFANFLSPEK